MRRTILVIFFSQDSIPLQSKTIIIFGQLKYHMKRVLQKDMFTTHEVFLKMIYFAIKMDSRDITMLNLKKKK